jgi:hypothetical protein
VTVAGIKLTRVTAGGVIVSVALTVPFRLAVIVTVICEVTEPVITVNAPVVLPAGIGILEETNEASAGLLLDSSTTVGPSGAWDRETVPLTDAPPSMMAGGPIVMDATCAAVVASTVSVAITVPLSVALICTVVCAGTPTVVIVNVPEVEPEGITSMVVASVATDGFELASVTVAPPEGAAEEIVTVPVEVPLTPPWTSEGISVRDTTLGGGGGSFTATALPLTPEHAQLTEQRTARSAARQTRSASISLIPGGTR